MRSFVTRTGSFVVALFLGICLLFGVADAARVQVKVVRVVDGDTIVVNWNGSQETVRMIGVDTPETVHPTKEPQPWGKEASDFTRQILRAGRIVQLEFDVEQRDRYGRLLAYVFLEDGTMFNALLLAEGLATVATFPPNVAYVDYFVQVQAQAQASCVGLWQSLCDAKMGDNVITLHVDLYQEEVTISNTSDQLIDLSGWVLFSVRGCQRFVFPAGTTLPAKGSIMVLSGYQRPLKEHQLFWEPSNIWNNSGDPAVLYDASHRQVTSWPDHVLANC